VTWGGLSGEGGRVQETGCDDLGDREKGSSRGGLYLSPPSRKKKKRATAGPTEKKRKSLTRISRKELQPRGIGEKGSVMWDTEEQRALSREVHQDLTRKLGPGRREGKVFSRSESFWASYRKEGTEGDPVNPVHIGERRSRWSEESSTSKKKKKVLYYGQI